MCRLANCTSNIHLFLYLAKNVETDVAVMIPNVLKSWIILVQYLTKSEGENETDIDTPCFENNR